VPGRVRRGRVSVGTFSAKSGYSRDVFGDVGVVSERVRRCRILSAFVRHSRFSVGTCSIWSGMCRDVFGEVGLGSGHVRRGVVFVGTCPALSVNVGT